MKCPSIAYDPLSKQKAPKVLADALTWMNAALVDFGIAGLSLRVLIEFLKSSLQNSNATVRTSATKTLVTLKLFAGSSSFISLLLAFLAEVTFPRRQRSFGRSQSTATEHY
jgi:hypothetical protein